MKYLQYTHRNPFQFADTRPATLPPDSLQQWCGPSTASRSNFLDLRAIQRFAQRRFPVLTLWVQMFLAAPEVPFLRISGISGSLPLLSAWRFGTM